MNFIPNDATTDASIPFEPGQKFSTNDAVDSVGEFTTAGKFEVFECELGSRAHTHSDNYSSAR